jgi:hypothetical protein
MSERTITVDQVLRMTRQLPPGDKLRLISLLSEHVRDEIDEAGEPVDMLSLAGLGAELWQEIDVEEYLAQERASWER